jgi:hypothetical protein
VRTNPTRALDYVWRVGASCALYMVGACSDAAAPAPLPPDAREFTPEPVYRDWWQQMERCSGRSAPFDAVRWYVVPGEAPFRVAGIPYPVIGYWDQRANHIVLLEYLPTQRAPVIRHEALHAILRRTDHPPRYFEELCGAAIGGPDSPD